MKVQTWRHLVLLVIVALPLVLASDCPGSSPLEPGNGDTLVVLENANISPTNRFIDDPEGDFDNFIFPDFAGVQVLRVWIEPLDPAAVAAAPSFPLELLGQIPFNSDWFFLPSIERVSVLSNGTYRVFQVDLGEVVLQDSSDGMGGNAVDSTDWDDPDNPICQDFIRFFESGSTSPEMKLTNFDGEVLFDVDGTSGGHLKVRIDAEAFQDAWYQTTTCNSCNCPALYDPDDPSTLNCQCFVENFSSSSFRLLSSSYLTFE